MTLSEFQEYLSKKASEFSDMADRMTTDILRDIYMTASSVYQEVYAKSFMIDLGSEGNGLFSKVVVDNTCEVGEEDEG